MSEEAGNGFAPSDVRRAPVDDPTYRKTCPAPNHLGPRDLLAQEAFYRNAQGKDGYANWCRDCLNRRREDRRKAERAAQGLPAVRTAPAPRDGRRAPQAGYARLLEDQGGLCRLCKKPPRKELTGDLERLKHYFFVGDEARIEMLLHDRCDLLLRVGHDDPLEHLSAAALLIDLGTQARALTQTTHARAHDDRA